MVKSPCVEICLVDPKTNLCIGCKRSLLEIENWNKFSNLKKNEIMDKLNARKKSMNLDTK